MVSEKRYNKFKEEVYDLVGDEYTVLRLPTKEEIENKIAQDGTVLIRHNCEFCKNRSYFIKPFKFINGQRCMTCTRRQQALKDNSWFMKKFKEKFSNVYNEYEIITEYKESHIPMKFHHKICDKTFEIEPTQFLNNRKGCPICSKNRKKTIEEVRNFIKKLGNDEYILISNKYKNVTTKLEIKHLTCGNIFLMNYGDFRSGNRCPKCALKNRIKIRTKEPDDFVKEVHDLVGDEYTILEDYKKWNIKVLIRHNSCGYEWKVKPNVFLSGHRCPKCALKNCSLKEKELADYIEEKYKMDIIRNDRSHISKELDIFIPEKNIAIEFNGLYWHSEYFKSNNYHIKKTEECEKNNIRLLQIFEDEWDNKKDIVKSKLRYILNKTDNTPRIYARKCKVKPILESKKKNKFLNKHHIQGEDKSSISLGLYWKNPKTNKLKLVSVMTFCKPRKALGQKNSKFDYELSRFASNTDYIVVGAFGKLFKYFERNYKWNSLITYADKRWSQGNVYIKNGWVHDHDSKPNYWYTDGVGRFHRYKFRKQNLKNLFPDIYDDNKSEHEIMLQAGYHRIYDCGNMVFTYKKR